MLFAAKWSLTALNTQKLKCPGAKWSCLFLIIYYGCFKFIFKGPKIAFFLPTYNSNLWALQKIMDFFKMSFWNIIIYSTHILEILKCPLSLLILEYAWPSVAIWPCLLFWILWCFHLKFFIGRRPHILCFDCSSAKTNHFNQLKNSLKYMYTVMPSMADQCCPLNTQMLVQASLHDHFF